MIEVRWLAPDQPIAPLVDLFIDGTDETFISHSELMFGRAQGVGSWSPDLAEQLRDDFERRREAPAPARAIDKSSNTICAVSRDALLGFMNVQTCFDVPTPFGVLEDAVVAPDHRREGIFDRMLSFYLGELQRLEVPRVFLESGIGNGPAHEAFEKRGFRPVSVTMMSEI